MPSHKDPSEIPTYLLDATPNSGKLLADYERKRADLAEARLKSRSASEARRGKFRWIGGPSGPDRRMIPAPGVSQTEFDELAEAVSSADRATSGAEWGLKRAAEAVFAAVAAIDPDTRADLASAESKRLRAEIRDAIASLSEAVPALDRVRGDTVRSDQVGHAVRTLESESPVEVSR